MKWKIFNIGKANAEIERLEAELTSAKAATPDNTQLTEALASNEEISKQLTQANADLVTAKASVKSLTTQLESAQTDLNGLGGSLKAACGDLKLSVKDGATNADMITALQNGVSSTLAKLNVKQEDIPGGKATTSQQSDTNKKTLAEFKALSHEARNEFFRKGGKLAE